MDLIGGPLKDYYYGNSELNQSFRADVDAGNTCALRLSYAFNKAGYKLNGDFKGANDMRIFTSAESMTVKFLIPYVERQFQYTNVNSTSSTGIFSQYRAKQKTAFHVDVIYNNNVGTNIYSSIKVINWIPGR